MSAPVHSPNAALEQQVPTGHHHVQSASSSELQDGDDGAGDTSQGSIVIHVTPEKDHNFSSSFEELAIGSPPRSRSSTIASGARGLPSSPETPRSTTYSQGGTDSSFEIIQDAQSPHWLSSGSSTRAVSGSSAASSFGASLGSQAPSTKASPSVQNIKPIDQSTPFKLPSSRPFAGITPRHPSTVPQSQHLKVNVHPDSPPPVEPRRGSGKVRARSSLSPMLSPIPDLAHDPADVTLDPTASSFELPSASLEPQPFPEDASFKYIVLYGKNTNGDLTKEARKALAKLGLKSIPAMHGPLSLPYARCPSYVPSAVH